MFHFSGLNIFAIINTVENNKQVFPIPNYIPSFKKI